MYLIFCQWHHLKLGFKEKNQIMKMKLGKIQFFRITSSSSPLNWLKVSLKFHHFILGHGWPLCWKLLSFSAHWPHLCPHSALFIHFPHGTLPLSAAAKSLQSCLTLCDPIDGSPPGSRVPGILPARTLKWVAISFSHHSLICNLFLIYLFSHLPYWDIWATRARIFSIVIVHRSVSNT